MASTSDNLYVTYVDVDRDLLKIWGQKNRISATYIERHLLQLLPEFNRSPCPNPTQVQKGMFCFAKYRDDNYYRARVISRVMNDSVSVLFVDYGNRDVIKLSNIRIQEGNEGDVLAKMSEQAEEYYLAGITAPSVGWTKEIVSKIRRDICYEEFLYHIVAQVGDQKILDLKFHNEDFSSYLVKKQLANPLSLPVQRQMILAYCCLVQSNVKPEAAFRDFPKMAFSPSVPPPNMRSFRPLNVTNEGMVQIVKTNGPVNFSQSPSSHIPPARPITSSLQQMNQHMMENSYFSPGNVSGNQMHANVNSQQPMNPTVNPLLNTQFNPLQMVKEGVNPFTSNSNIIQILAQQVKQYITEDNAKAESESEKFPHHYLNSVLEVGSTYNVIISYIDDGPWSFSVQLLSSETELRKLMDELVSTELVPLKPPIILGHPCIASSALYGNLCRGVVVSISHSAVKVYFVDFGNTEDLPSSSIYELPPKFFKIRVLSQKFSLSGLQKVVYSDDIKKFFKEVVQDEFLVLRVASLEDDNLPTCELYLKDTNIKRILNEKIREQRSSLQEDLPKVGETENVIVTWVVSPQKFFVQLHKRDADLNALKLELAEIESKGQKLMYEQLRVGLRCVCLYENDGKWYRALVTSADSENAITVFYVDYGNSETVNISRLRKISTSSLINELSNQAIQCCLQGFENKAFDQELTNKLEALVLEKDVQMTVVSPENELLCVQLFDNRNDISKILLTSTLPKLESLEISSQAWSSNSGNANAFEKQKRFDGTQSRDKNGTFSTDKTRQKSTSGRPFNNFQSFKTPVQPTPSKSKRRVEENWRSDANKDNYWKEPNPNDHNSSKIRGFRQARETDTWDNNNNNSNHNNYINNNGNKSSINSKFSELRQDRGGRDDWNSGTKLEKNGGFRQEKTRYNWNSRNENNFGDKKFEENRNGRGTADDRKFGAGDRKRPDRSRGRDENNKKFERNENREFSGNDRNFDQRKSSRKPINKENIAPAGSKFEEKVVHIGSCENGIVTYYFSPHEFFIQLLAQEKDFKKMMSDIQTYYMDKYSLRDPVEAGDIVIAQFSLDKVLYRAEVVKPSPVTVRYVDYGNQEPVGPKAIWAVDKQFLVLPKQVIKCRLSNIEPIGSDWPPPGGAADKFFEFAEYKCTFLSVQDDLYEISLEDVASGKDIAHELIAAGHARPMAPKLDVQKVDYSLLPSQILKLYVSHVVSSSNFYVILNPKGVEVIENELKTLADDKKNLISLNEALIKPGMPCLITNDEVSWHRGSIVETDENKVLVWFSDKGGSFEVTPDKLMCLPDYLKVFQPQAVKCSLHEGSFKQSEEFKTAVEFKHHLVSVVSATDECLSVILYDEEGQKLDFHKGVDFPQAIDPISHLPIISQEISIVISHLESPNEIYIQRSADCDEIVSLTERLSNFYSEEKNDFEIEGEFVAAKSLFYETWYRGRLLSSSEDGLEVFYIDYGNKEVLPRENVRRLDRSFLSLNPFTKKSTLDVEFDADKTEDINNKISELCQDKSIVGYFKNEGGKLISEFTVNGERITRLLSLTTNESDKFVEFFSLEKKKEESKPKTEQKQQLAKVPESAELKVIVSHIDSPNQFWVYKESLSNELHQFQDKLQKCCEVFPDKRNVQVDDIVAAVFSDMWYRARVVSVDGSELTVQFIDYGNTFIVDTSCNTVKELTEEFLRVPVFATPYALTGTWDKNSTSKFEEIFLQNEEPVKVVLLKESDPAIVDLYLNGRSISKMLEELICAEDEKGDLCSVYISHFNSPNDFFIQRESSEDAIKELNERLVNFSDLKCPSSIEENRIYSAKFPDDGAWYRAKARKKHGDAVEVIFIDYGNTSNVTEVKCLPNDLVNIPNLAENCSLLYPETSDSWSEAACKKFAEFADGRKLKMEVVVNTTKKPIVKLFDENKNVSEVLGALCENDGRSEVYISHALSPTEFFIQYVDDENYKLIMDKLENEEVEDLKERKPGTLCQALFAEDGYWYRAKILRELDEGVEVFFIDFGNTSVAKEVKKLPPEIEEFPPVALRCSLNLPETNIPESVKEEFINLTAGGASVFRALVIVPGEVNVVSLKLGGRILEETLNLDVIPEENTFFSHPFTEGFPHSQNYDTDDGKNSKKNLMANDYLLSNLADELKKEESFSNETDEEKRVKIAISGMEVSDGFKSDDEKGIEGTSPSGFLNATDNELMEENSEMGNISEASTVDYNGQILGAVEVYKKEEDADEVIGKFGELEKTLAERERVTDIKQNGVSLTSDSGNSSMFECSEIGSFHAQNSRNKVHKIVPGSISRGEDETFAETSPPQHRKLTFSEKLVPGSISRGISLESMQSEQKAAEVSPERQISQSAPSTPSFTRRNDSYVKCDPNDRLVPGCISTGVALHCDSILKKTPVAEKIVSGAVNGSFEDV